jgi:Skp family chaperone for outer membrane proteins
MILLATGFAVLVAGAYCASLFAQGTGTPPTTPAPTGTKVGVVNVGYVFSKWKRAQRLKAELEHAAEPYNQNAKKLQDEMTKWDAELHKGGLTKQEIDIRQDSIEKNKRNLQDLAKDMRKVLGKKSEDDLVVLWKEANQCIGKVSEHYGFSIVFGYGDPLDKALMDLFPNINRKMNAMDGGATLPLYIHGSSDLSDPVAQTLNQWDDYRQKQASGSK